MLILSLSDEAVAIRQLIEEHQSELKDLHKQLELSKADLDVSKTSAEESKKVCVCGSGKGCTVL